MGSRWLDETRSRRASEQQSKAVADETAAQRGALAKDKPEVLRKLADMQAAGDHEGAIKLASRYRLAADAEIQAAYTRSVGKLSDTQTLARMSDLLTRGCVGIQAIAAARTMIDRARLAGEAVPTDSWRSERLDASEHFGAIRARLVELAEQKPIPAQNALLARLRGDHAPRLQPRVMYAVLSNEPDASKYLCVWRVTGNLPSSDTSGGRTIARPFEMVVWFGPSATERTLEHDLLRVSGL